ncbi:TATA element modulatory factor 1 [Batrachochytrium dendrobatidis]
MSGWFANITSSEGAAAFTSLVKQAMTTVESGIDKVLDIQPDDKLAKPLLPTLEYGIGGSSSKKLSEPTAFSDTKTQAASSSIPSVNPMWQKKEEAKRELSRAPGKRTKTQDELFIDMLGGLVSTSKSAIASTFQLEKSTSQPESSPTSRVKELLLPKLKSPISQEQLSPKPKSPASQERHFPRSKPDWSRLSSTNSKSNVPAPLSLNGAPFNEHDMSEPIEASGSGSPSSPAYPTRRASSRIFENFNHSANDPYTRQRSMSDNIDLNMRSSVSAGSSKSPSGILSFERPQSALARFEITPTIIHDLQMEPITNVKSSFQTVSCSQPESKFSAEPEHFQDMTEMTDIPDSWDIPLDDPIKVLDQSEVLNLAPTIESKQFEMDDQHLFPVIQPTIAKTVSEPTGMLTADRQQEISAVTSNSISLEETFLSNQHAPEIDVENTDLVDQPNPILEESVSKSPVPFESAHTPSKIEPVSDYHDTMASTQGEIDVKPNLIEISILNTELGETLSTSASETFKIVDALSKKHEAEVADITAQYLAEVKTMQDNVDALKTRIQELEIYIVELKAERDRGVSSIRNSVTDNRVNELTRALRDKEEAIQGLLSEGEKLSKDILKANTKIKGLRAVESELGKELKETQRRLEVCLADLAQIKEKLSKTSDSEKSLAAKVKELENYNDQHVRHRHKLEKELASVREKSTELQSLFENCKKELDEIQTKDHDTQIAAQSATLEAEMRENSQLRSQLEESQKKAAQAEDTLHKEIFELRTSLTRAQDESGWKEDNFRQEIETLHRQLHAAEARNEDLAAMGQDSTEPLMQQIQILQTQCSQGQEKQEHIERLLTQKLHDAEKQLGESMDREALLRDRTLELTNRVALLEKQNVQELQEKHCLLADQADNRLKTANLEEQVKELQMQSDLLKDQFQKNTNLVKKEFEEKLAAKLLEESEKWKKKLQVEQQQLQTSSVARHEKSHSISSDISANPVSTERQHLDGNHVLSANGVSSATLFPPGTPAVVIIERLQLMIKQSESQISSLQLQLRMATQTRNEMSDEFVRLTAESEELKAKADKAQAIESELTELQKRYNTALEILGEKTERAEELQEDIKDMRLAFKAQVEDLVRQLGRHAIKK